MTLIYDLPEYNKEVAYVSTKPVDYKPSINDAGDEISFDAKISALSSQHEDSFFRLKITVWDPNPSSPYSVPLTALSHPIKVISKPINQRKNKKTETGSSRRRSNKSSTSSPPLGQDKPATPPKEACLSSCEATDRLEKLELQQQQTLHLLHQIVSRTEATNGLSYPVISSPEDTEFRPAKRIKQEKTMSHYMVPDNMHRPIVEDFEHIFYTMLQAYSLMSSQDKVSVIGRLLRSLSHKDNEKLEELFDNLRTGGVDNYLSSFPYSSGFLAPSENLAMPFLPEDIYDS